MVGCFIGLFVKRKILLDRFKDLKTTKIKTGLGGSTGNKGAVILRFKLDDSNIALVNCHLQSGNNKGSLRTDEINFIFDNAFKNEPDGKVSLKAPLIFIEICTWEAWPNVSFWWFKLSNLSTQWLGPCCLQEIGLGVPEIAWWNDFSL